MLIVVFAHGSSFAFIDLGNGLCDIGMSSREIKNEEVILLQTRGLGNMFGLSNKHVLALDGLAIIVHPSNPVQSLSADQVGKIFSGEIVNWKAITGENSTISLYARETNSGTHVTFQQFVMKRIKDDLDTKAQEYLERVVEYLKVNGYPQLKLIGFSDGEGNKETNVSRLNKQKCWPGYFGHAESILFR
ncbi:MAG: substrate-binding domain-containing protein [Bacteroidetes bacterium]|nr:substrate-binding domain-containing protein [Bacteroidota bacterium]